MTKNAKTKVFLEVLPAVGLILALSLITLALANPKLNEPGRDGGFFMYVGQAIANGKGLYTEIWDSKGPMIFWINALGVGRNGNRWGLFFLELFFMTGWLAIAYGLLRRHSGLIQAVFGIVGGAFCLKFSLGYGNFTEEYSLLFTFLALVAFSWLLAKPEARFWPFVLIAASTLLNFFLRANNIATQAVTAILALALIWQRGGFKAIKLPVLGLLTGVLLAGIPISGVLLAQGSLKAMWDASFIYNFAYSAAGGDNAPVLAVIHGSLLPGLNLFKGWSWLFVLGWFIAVWRIWQARKNPLAEPWALLALLAWPLEVVFSSISGRQHPHYFICWVPMIVLLTGFAINFLLKEVIKPQLLQKAERLEPAIVLLTALLFIGLLSFDALYPTSRSVAAAVLLPQRDNEFRSNLALRLREITASDDRVLVFAGQAGINVMAQRESIDAALFYPAINDSPVGMEVQAKFFETLQEQMPRLILDGYQIYPQRIPAINPEDRSHQNFQVKLSANLDQVLNWINAHYTAIEVLDNYVIYQLR